MADITEYDIKIKFSESGAEKTADDVKKVQSSVDKLKSAVKGLGIGVVLKKATDAIGGFINKTSDYIETVNLFRASMGSATDEAQKFIDKAEGVLGLDPGNLMDSISSFYNMADGMGIASDRAYTMSQNLTQLAGDLSSFANISFEEAQKKLMSGFAGQVLPLRRYGIALDQASLQETAYSLGLQQKVKEMTRAQKSELIYYQIMTSTQKMQGDLGRSLLSPANAVRVMKTEFQRLARAVGSIFIPIMMKLIPVVRAVTQLLTEAAQAIARFFGFEWSDYNSDISSVGTLLDGVGEGIMDIGDEADETAGKLNKMLMPFDELNNITSSTGTGSGSGLGGIGGGGGLGIDLPEYDMFETATSGMVDKINKIKETIKTILPILQTIGAVIAAWKISNSVINTLDKLFNFSKETKSSALKIAIGLTLMISGITIAFGSEKKILEGDLSVQNLLLGLFGAGAAGVGASMVASGMGLAASGPIGWTVAIALTLILLTTWAIKKDEQMYPKIAEAQGLEYKDMGFWDKQKLHITTTLEILGLKETDGDTAWGKAIEEMHKRFPILNLGRQIKQDFQEFGSSLQDVWNGIKGFFIDVWNAIKGFFSTIGKWLKEKFEDFGDFFENELPGDIDYWLTIFLEKIAEVLGIQAGGDSTEAKGIGESLVNGFKAGITGKWDEMWKSIGGEGGFFPKIIEKVKGLFGIHSPSTVFEEIGENLIQGLVNGIGNIWNTLTSKFDDIKNLTNFSWSLPSLKVPHMSWSTQPAPEWAAKILRALSLPTDVPKLNVSWYAEGGFPSSGQLFIANEAGPELVGNIGNRTAVANKDQITTAIANATYEAISRALAENNQNNGQPIIVNVGNEQLYKGYTRYQNQQSNMYGINV